MAACKLTRDVPLTDDLLQCPLCLHQLEIPVTLEQCLHTFCKECLDELPQETQNDIIGWTCPRCGKFSSTEEVRQHDFLQKLLQFKDADSEDPIECKYCHSKTEVKWQCSDCRIELCSPCSVNHVNIPLLKKHRITTLVADTASTTVIDELLLCPRHEEKPLELHCRECEVLMCVLCKIDDHDTHATERVSTALSRIVPEVKKKTETIAQSVEHLEAKIKVIRSKIEDTKQLCAESRETVHERIEYMINKLREIKDEQEEILVKEERQAVTRLEETKLELEAKVEGMKQLLNITSITTSVARNVSLLEQLQGNLLQNIRTCSEVQYEPMLINIPGHTLVVSINEDQCKTGLRKTVGRLQKRDFIYKVTSDGYVFDNHYISCDISAFTDQGSSKPTETVHLLAKCARISLSHNSLYVPLKDEITVYDVDSKRTTHIDVPFVPLVVKSLPNHQIAVGSRLGLYLYDSLEPNAKPLKLKDHGKYSDIDVYGDIFYVFRCDTSEIVTFKSTGSDMCKNIQNLKEVPWITEGLIVLSCILKPHTYNTFRRTEETFVVSSVNDRCLFVCDLKGTVLRRVMRGNDLAVCGVDVDENVILADYNERILLSYSVKEDTIKTRHMSSLPGEPWDFLFDNSGNLWVLVEMGDNRDFRLLKFSSDSA